MTSRRVSGIPISFLSVALAVLVAGCADARSTDPTLTSIESDQVTWQSPEGAFWGIADVLERDGVIWVLSPVEPFVHGLRSGAEVVAFGSQGDGPGEFRSARALLPWARLARSRFGMPRRGSIELFPPKDCRSPPETPVRSERCGETLMS